MSRERRDVIKDMKLKMECLTVGTPRDNERQGRDRREKGWGPQSRKKHFGIGEMTSGGVEAVTNVLAANQEAG